MEFDILVAVSALLGVCGIVVGYHIYALLKYHYYEIMGEYYE